MERNARSPMPPAQATTDYAADAIETLNSRAFAAGRISVMVLPAMVIGLFLSAFG